MKQEVAPHPGKQIHVILDNLSSQKPKRDMWLARHTNVHLHYTPTHASWLNQIEVCLSILADNSLNSGASFRSVREPGKHIDSFIASHTDTVRPFVWLKTIAHQKRLNLTVSQSEMVCLHCNTGISG